MKKPNSFQIKRALTCIGLMILITVAFNTETKASVFDIGMPSASKLQEMTKTVLLDFNDAVQDADFSDFYSKICAPWQKQITAKEMEEVFKGFIDKKIDISNIKPLDAVFSAKPEIRTELGYKTLVLQGHYATTPNKVKFLLHFIDDNGEWKLSRIEVSTLPD